MAMEQTNLSLVGKVDKVVTFNYHRFIEACIDLTAGSFGGIACVIVGQPLDTVKVKMQTFPDLYSNSLRCFNQTFINDGIKGLYAGTVPALIANVAENSILFCAYGVCQSAVKSFTQKKKIEELNPFENACAGFLAAFFSSFTLCPTELIKCRLQAAREMGKNSSIGNKQIGAYDITRQILKHEGIQGLFRGLPPTFVREMPGYFCFFGGYEISRVLLTPPGKTKDDIGMIRTIICGGLGGTALWVSIFPFDVVKSRIQVNNSKGPMLYILKDILQKEGFRALYKGLGPTLLRTFPASGALFVAYEYTKNLMCYLTGIERA